MTPIDDLELGQRLRALRVDPPDTGFEARLAARLADLTSDPPARAPAPTGKLVRGRWRRRPALLLVAAAALSLAGAAAALEGGVIEWFRARMGVRDTAAENSSPSPEPARAPRPAQPATLDDTAPENPTDATRHEPASPQDEAEPARPRPPERQPPGVVPPPPTVPIGPSGASRGPALQAPHAVPRLGVDRNRQAAPPPAATGRGAFPIVPRVEVAPRAGGRPDNDGRGGRVAPGGGAAVTHERGRELERIRELGRARRERAGTSGERPRVLERLRERRERVSTERRELSNERVRRERPGR
jgi:hypothetical protein